jgi:hypothetical protein
MVSPHVKTVPGSGHASTVADGSVGREMLAALMLVALCRPTKVPGEHLTLASFLKEQLKGGALSRLFASGGKSLLMYVRGREHGPCGLAKA